MDSEFLRTDGQRKFWNQSFIPGYKCVPDPLGQGMQPLSSSPCAAWQSLPHFMPGHILKLNSEKASEQVATSSGSRRHPSSMSGTNALVSALTLAPECQPGTTLKNISTSHNERTDVSSSPVVFQKLPAMSSSPHNSARKLFCQDLRWGGNPSWGQHSLANLVDEDAEAQRVQATYPSPHSWSVVRWGAQWKAL